MKTLGILFLLIGIGCAIGGFSNTTEKFPESMYRKSYEEAQQGKERLRGALADSGVTGAQAMPYYAFANNLGEDAKGQYLKYKSARETRMQWFFISAGVLCILGLILCVVPAQQRPVVTASS